MNDFQKDFIEIINLPETGLFSGSNLKKIDNIIFNASFEWYKGIMSCITNYEEKDNIIINALIEKKYQSLKGSKIIIYKILKNESNTTYIFKIKESNNNLHYLKVIRYEPEYDLSKILSIKFINYEDTSNVIFTN